jgi:predicted Rossmann fold flavoprotein
VQGAPPIILVVGAGAAGLVAAIFAARSSRGVVLLESTTDGGRKILISGGGRCNVLPQALQPERFVSDSPPALVRRLLRSWPLAQQRAFIEQDLGIPLKLEADSRKYFPVSDRARDVRDALVSHARTAGVEIRFGTRMTALTKTSQGWRITADDERSIDAAAVIVATGGRSVPATGSDGAALDLLALLGHTVHPTYPALTPLTAEPAVHAALSGVSLPVRVRARFRTLEAESAGGFLFTHRGYSGPAILDVSHVAVRSRLEGGRASIRIRWTDLDRNAWERELQSSAGLVLTTVSRRLPSRLAEQLLAESNIPLRRHGSELRRPERNALVERLTSYELPWSGDEGFKKAEVTGGGIALDEADPRTLESRLHPGLFLCGELLDAFGPIGGHNFAWAWATGRIAGLSAATRGLKTPGS